MASSSLTLSQALLFPSTPSSDHHRHHLSIPRFFGLKRSPISSTSSSFAKRAYTPIRLALSSRGHVVRATAVETLQTTETSLVEKFVNTIRFLAIDGVEKANSDYPSLPMGCALMGHILYNEIK